MSSCTGLREQEEEDQKDHESDPEGVVNTKCLSIIEEVLELISCFLSDTGGDGVRVSVIVDHVGNASCHEHGTKGRNKRRKLKLSD